MCDEGVSPAVCPSLSPRCRVRAQPHLRQPQEPGEGVPAHEGVDVRGGGTDQKGMTVLAIHSCRPSSRGVSRAAVPSDAVSARASHLAWGCLKIPTSTCAHSNMLTPLFNCQHLSNIWYSFSSLVTSTTVPSLPRCAGGLNRERRAARGREVLE